MHGTRRGEASLPHFRPRAWSVTVFFGFYYLMAGACQEQIPKPTRPLLEAAEAGDLSQVQAHIHHKSNLEVTNKFRINALHKAVIGDHPEVARALLDAGVKIETRDISGYTSLLRALYLGKKDLAWLLLERDADPIQTNNYGEEALHLAAKQGYTAMCLELLSRPNTKVNIQDRAGWTPLHLAVNKGREETVRALLDQQADPNLATTDGTVPMHRAVASYGTIARLLLDHGAEVKRHDARGQGVLYWAAGQNDVELRRRLLDKGAGPKTQTILGDQPLHRAAVYGLVAIMRVLIEKGADIHAANKKGEQALHLAYKGAHEEAARFLLGLGADPKARTKAGQTPLDLAYHSGHGDRFQGLPERIKKNPDSD